MRRVLHSLVIAFGVLALTLTWTVSPAVRLAATALIMGPTLVPDPRPHYLADMTGNYIIPFFGRPDRTVGVHTPAQFWPIGSLNPLTFDWDALTFDESVAAGAADLADAVAAQPAGTDLIVLGYSQSTRNATIVKRELIGRHGDDFSAYPDIDFVLVSNLNKPNGGILQRGAVLGPIAVTIPVLGITFDGATPTDSPADPGDPSNHALHTTDFTVIHDGVSDAPVYLNPLTVANALAGFAYLHDYPPPSATGPFYQGSAGDTDYYVYGTDILPILRPLGDLGVPRPVLLALDEPLRVVIETTGYRRDISPGTPTPFGLFPVVDPVRFAANVVKSVPVGLDDAFADMGDGRPFGTDPSGPYGVGGPPLPDPPQPASLFTTAPQPAEPTTPATRRTSTRAALFADHDGAPTEAEAPTTTSPRFPATLRDRMASVPHDLDGLRRSVQGRMGRAIDSAPAKVLDRLRPTG